MGTREGCVAVRGVSLEFMGRAKPRVNSKHVEITGSGVCFLKETQERRRERGEASRPVERRCHEFVQELIKAEEEVVKGTRSGQTVQTFWNLKLMEFRN